MTSINGDFEKLGDDIFDKYNCYPGDGERNHCLRLIEFARLHARQMNADLDPGLTHMAAMLHDLGLMVALRPGTNYLTRTVEITKKELLDCDIDDQTWSVLEESLLFNHAMIPPHSLAPPVEAFRRAVFTEHSRGLQRFGVSRHAVKGVFRAVPWANFTAVLADFIWKTVIFEPTTIPQIFIPHSR